MTLLPFHFTLISNDFPEVITFAFPPNIFIRVYELRQKSEDRYN